MAIKNGKSALDPSNPLTLSVDEVSHVPLPHLLDIPSLSNTPHPKTFYPPNCS